MALLMGRLFVAALFLPSGVHKLMTFSAYAASLKAKGLPFAAFGRWCWSPPRLSDPGSDHRRLAALDGSGVGGFHRCHALGQPRSSIVGAVFRPRQNGELYRTLAIMGGLLLYFASGPGAWSWQGGTGRGARA